MIDVTLLGPPVSSKRVVSISTVGGALASLVYEDGTIMELDPGTGEWVETAPAPLTLRAFELDTYKYIVP